MSRKRKEELPVAVCDVETDPFQLHRTIEPFVWGFYSQETGFRYFYSEPSDPAFCNIQFLAFLRSLPRSYCIYAHNGGKFDWIFLNKYWSGKPLIIGSRLTRANLLQHEIRDSYSIIPTSLSTAGTKDEISYDLMSPEKRYLPSARTKILSYLQTDCTSLYSLVSRFRSEFGNKLTIASAALTELKKTYVTRGAPYGTLDATFDASLRPFYFGGRTQIFKTGELFANFNIYDVNSMYPFVMKSQSHPIASSGEWNIGTDISESTRFLCVDATSSGAFPLRTKTGLSFPHARATFFVTSHEFLAAQRLKLCKLHRIIYTYDCEQTMNFGAFIDKFYNLRMKAAAEQDAVMKLFYKLIMNSAYGKFGINPMNYLEYEIVNPGDDPPPPPYYPCYEMFNGLVVYARPNSRPNYINVATAASITGAARALLLENMVRTRNLIYCDTDSLIASSLASEISDVKLGAFKQEASFSDWIGLAPKLYACLENETIVKAAHKGIPLPSLKQWRSMVKGETILFPKAKEAPTFKLTGEQLYIERNIRMCVNSAVAPWPVLR